MNSNSKNYEKKYKKYKNRYLELKSQQGTLIGGDCDPYPNPEEEDFTTQNLLDLCPNERITIQNKCYEVKGLYQWIIVKKHDILPGTITTISEEEKQNLIKAYKILKRPPSNKNLYPYLSYSQLPVHVTLNKSHLQNDNYEEEIRKKYDIEGLDMLEIPQCVTENIYRQLIVIRHKILKISGFGRRPDIDNMFLTVSDPGTGTYDIDIWIVKPITNNLENKFHLNIGNWNVVRRGEYKMFASNIYITFARSNNDYIINSPDLTFDSALQAGIYIQIHSFVHDYDTDCDTFSFHLKYRHNRIKYDRLQFHNHLSRNIQRTFGRRGRFSWNID